MSGKMLNFLDISMFFRYNQSMGKQEMTVEQLLVLIDEKDRRIAELERETVRVAELENQVQWLMNQLCLAKHKQFGASSEQTDLNQLNLFNEAEQILNDICLTGGLKSATTAPKERYARL
jgi:L-ribulose-5-phosphate 3-epimerase UlaE